MKSVGTAVTPQIGLLTEASQRYNAARLLQGGGALLTVSAFGNGLSYLLGVVVARVLGPSEFGLYVLALAIVNVLTPIVGFGLDTASIRFISSSLGTNQTGKARQIMILAAALAGILGVIGAIGLALAAPWLADRVYDKPDLTSLLWTLAALLPVTALSTVVLAGIQARETVRYTALIRYVWEPLGKILLVSLALWAGWRLGGVLLMLIVVSVGTLACGLWAACRVWQIGVGDLGRFDMDVVRDLLSFCLPLSVGTLFGALASRADLLVLGYWTTIEQVGLYQAAFQTSAILALILGAFDMVFAPMIGRTLAHPQRDGLADLYQSACRLCVMLTVPLGVLLIIFSEEILGWFGGGFAAGSAYLVVLVIGQIINSGIGEASTVLLMGGHSPVVMRNAVFFGGVLLVSLIVIVPMWGAVGAAVAVAGNLVAVGITRVYQVASLYGIWPATKELWKPIAAGAITTAIMLLAKEWVPSAAHLILAPGACGMYVGLLVWMGLHPADRATIGAIVARIRLVPA